MCTFFSIVLWLLWGLGPPSAVAMGNQGPRYSTVEIQCSSSVPAKLPVMLLPSGTPVSSGGHFFGEHWRWKPAGHSYHLMLPAVSRLLVSLLYPEALMGLPWPPPRLIPPKLGTALPTVKMTTPVASGASCV